MKTIFFLTMLSVLSVFSLQIYADANLAVTLKVLKVSRKIGQQTTVNAIAEQGTFSGDSLTPAHKFNNEPLSIVIDSADYDDWFRAAYLAGGYLYFQAKVKPTNPDFGPTLEVFFPSKITDVALRKTLAP